ncbi:MAG TPA: hypothetical protein PKZ97_17890 [Azospirillaceae bacterium]|nr:hypothetical protein [Azospirillaceae bacterium]
MDKSDLILKAIEQLAASVGGKIDDLREEVRAEVAEIKVRQERIESTLDEIRNLAGANHFHTEGRLDQLTFEFQRHVAGHAHEPGKARKRA